MMVMQMKITNTGLYRVTKVKNYTGSKPYRFAYQIRTDLFKADIRSTNILKLKEKVTKAGLIWCITDKDLAIITANEEGVNPMDLNSNLDSDIVRVFNDFTDIELGKCTGCGFCLTLGKENCVYEKVRIGGN